MKGDEVNLRSRNRRSLHAHYARCGVRCNQKGGKMVTPRHELLEEARFESATLPALDARLAEITARFAMRK